MHGRLAQSISRPAALLQCSQAAALSVYQRGWSADRVTGSQVDDQRLALGVQADELAQLAKEVHFHTSAHLLEDHMYFILILLPVMLHLVHMNSGHHEIPYDSTE